MRRKREDVKRALPGCTCIIHEANGFTNYLKKNGKTISMALPNKHKLTKSAMIKSILSRLVKHWIDSKAGVFIKGLGYFYVNRTPFAEKSIFNRRPIMRNRGFRMAFIPTKNSPLVDYNIDYSISGRNYVKIKEKIKEGNVYLNVMSSVLSYDEILDGYNLNVEYVKWVKENGF